jgi:hypothetical protein
MKPNINLNGTDPRTLYSNIANLRHRVGDALEALKKVWPHRRDYLGDEPTFLADRNEVDSWQQALGVIMDGTERTLAHLADQDGYKKKE